MFINSDKIKVFPFAKYNRPTNDLGSRLFYECNIARLVTQLIDTDGFIISGAVDTGASITETLKFNIKGYYFEITAGVSLIPDDIKHTDSMIYGVVTLNDNPEELSGQDNDFSGKFEALSITTIRPTEDTVFYLKLLEKVGEEWHIPEESYFRYNVSSINITKIDGKH